MQIKGTDTYKPIHFYHEDCIDNQILVQSKANTNWKDDNYRSMISYLKVNVFPNLLKDIIDKGKIGYSSTCEVNQLGYYYSIVDLLLMFKEEVLTISCTEGVDKFKEVYCKYDFECIKDKLVCIFNDNKTFKNLFNVLSLPEYPEFAYEQLCEGCTNAILLENGGIILLENNECLLLE